MMSILYSKYVEKYNKIIIDNETLEQVNLFNYLGNISYEGELDIDNKLNNFLTLQAF